MGSCFPPAPLAGPCVAQPKASSYPYGFEETLFTFELPLSARLGPPDGTILPYVGVAPGLVYDRSDVTADTGSLRFARLGTERRFSIHLLAGTQVRVGRGGFFFEWGFRTSPVERRPEGDSHLTSFEGALGYRLTL